MKAVLQRVRSSRVEVAGQVVGQIDQGWLVLLGIGIGDTLDIARYVADRSVHLRGFSDDQGKMNLSVQDVGGAMLVVSQFTLYADCIRGRRPSFDAAAPLSVANDLYEYFCDCVRCAGVPVSQGVFQADMQVTLTNDGPVTLIIEKNNPL
ncbi:MAG TPA: D-aminoacyl-tRNA deacylase [Pirellula sp.]|nr:D-aminoacyl-tRNA deacylase [Pirellula sp.]